MKKFYIIESTKERKSGHVSHLMVELEDGILHEISPATGRLLDNHNGYWTLKDYLEKWEYKLVKASQAIIVGYRYKRFFDYLVENNLIIEEI